MRMINLILLVLGILTISGPAFAQKPLADYGNVPQNAVSGVADAEPPFILELDAGGNQFRGGRQIVVNLDFTNTSSSARVDNIEFAFGITPASEPANPVFQDYGIVDSAFSRGGKYTIYTAKVVLTTGDYDVWSIVTSTDQFGNYSNGWTKKRIVVTGGPIPVQSTDVAVGKS